MNGPKNRCRRGERRKWVGEWMRHRVLHPLDRRALPCGLDSRRRLVTCCAALPLNRPSNVNPRAYLGVGATSLLRADPERKRLRDRLVTLGPSGRRKGKKNSGHERE